MAERKVRTIRVEGNVAYVPLTQGLEAIIDVEDVHLVAGANWHAVRGRGTFYASRAFRRRPIGAEIKLHRVIIGPPPEILVDHIDGNGLNCRRSNLRKATTSENLRNRPHNSNNKSGLKGICYIPSRGKWQASIASGGKSYFLGRFLTSDEAYKAYCAAAARFHGDFARLA